MTLTGTISPVLNGAEASVLLVPADGEDGTVIYLVDGAAAGLTRTQLTAVDHSRSLARDPADRHAGAGRWPAMGPPPSPRPPTWRTSRWPQSQPAP